MALSSTPLPRTALGGVRRAHQAPHCRHRDTARAMRLSEGAWIAAHCLPLDPAATPLKARPLRADWPRLAAALEALGEVMALTGNEACVHQQVGGCRLAAQDGGISHIQGAGIDVQLAHAHWAQAFAVEERLADGALQRSLQFFDARGQAVHKVFLRPDSAVAAYFDLLERFVATRVADRFEPADRRPPAEQPDDRVDVAGFRSAWTAMRDARALGGLLSRYGLARTQGLRLAPPSFASRVGATAAHEVLQRAAQDGTALQIAVASAGACQVHSGPVRQVELLGPWVRVQDPRFHLHLSEERIHQAWVVRQPTSDGLLHALELFDARGETIARLTGLRHTGHAESCAWRQLLASLPAEDH